jgi:hypothetical protein
MSVLDNPTDPTQWLWDRALFGQLIGRAMAHEVRHLYVGSGHAAAGLGSDSANLVKATNFSNVDKRAILRSIQVLERQQGRNPIVPTFPQSCRTKLSVLNPIFAASPERHFYSEDRKHKSPVGESG